VAIAPGPPLPAVSADDAAKLAAGAGPVAAHPQEATAITNARLFLKLVTSGDLSRPLREEQPPTLPA
jgi:hypothetical protein